MAPRRGRGLPTAFVGAGRLAHSVAPRLGPAGWPVVAVCARRAAAARALARQIDGARATTSLAHAAGAARLVLLAVPDREIAPLAARLAALRGVDWRSRTVLHHAGALGPDVLAPLGAAGAAVGLFHPLQCLGGSPLAGALLAGSRVRIEGDRRAEAVARRLARALGLVPLGLGRAPRESDRIAYHAAAALAANDLLALVEAAAAVLETTGVSRREAFAALLALARGTLAQAEHGGPAAARTGPAARGDRPTLERHLERLRRLAPDLATIHGLLSRRIAAAARARRRG